MGMLPRLSGLPIPFDDDESNLTTLINRQYKLNEDMDTHKNIPCIPEGSTIAVQREYGRSWVY